MAFSIYGVPHKSAERVAYGAVQTLEQAASEMKRLRQAGVLEVYAIGLDPEVAELPPTPRPVPKST